MFTILKNFVCLFTFYKRRYFFFQTKYFFQALSKWSNTRHGNFSHFETNLELATLLNISNWRQLLTTVKIDALSTSACLRNWIKKSASFKISHHTDYSNLTTLFSVQLAACLRKRAIETHQLIKCQYLVINWWFTDI